MGNYIVIRLSSNVAPGFINMGVGAPPEVRNPHYQKAPPKKISRGLTGRGQHYMSFEVSNQ